MPSLNQQKTTNEEELMIGQIYHVGLTVSDLGRSVAFYRDVLGLQYQGELLMEGCLLYTSDAADD